FESWTDVLREKLVQEGIVQSRAETLARLAIISLEGALIIARVEADATPVISAMDEVAAMMEREAVR
ncbi:MAG: TetR/AcrR family transcriptional regulator, partial [Hyphomicrobiales bacterium]|nr:TetR/AcrR family transcriptional regulator [Hyphomicrobiales bacterium]